MFKNLKRAAAIALCGAMTIGCLAGCGEKAKPTEQGSNGTTQGTNDVTNNTQNNENTPVKDTTPYYKTLDKNISGSIDVMVWSGDSEYHADLGHQNWAPEDISSQNVAAIYALAKEFNKEYPNIKINLYAKADDPNGNDTPWRQELENFKAEHGKYPDIYAANDLPGDLSDGMIADLSVFADDPMYQSFNQSIMATMNYYGFQAGLPQFMEPWGVYVNRALAEDNNIEVPSVDWDIDDYTDFITSADNKTFWGTIYGSATHFIDTGTNVITKQMSEYTGTGDRVNLASEEVADLISYIPKWSQSEIWTKNGEGAVDSAIMDDGWWWGFRFFCRNYLLAYEGDPWMLNTAALGKNENGEWNTNAVESSDWDIYPRPATDYRGNTVGICIDPMAIHNYAMDDGNPEWSEAEKAQLKLAYAFGSFWCGATESMQARADQNFNDNGTIKSCLNDSFPLVTGDAFYDQMKIWYSAPIHERYGNADLMPGFQYVVKLWEEGQVWDISDKTYPYYIYEDGNQKACLYEWLNITNADVVGVPVTDASWLDTVKANLNTWNKNANERFREAEKNIKAGLVKYYGFTEADFK